MLHSVSIAVEERVLSLSKEPAARDIAVCNELRRHRTLATSITEKGRRQRGPRTHHRWILFILEPRIRCRRIGNNCLQIRLDLFLNFLCRGRCSNPL